MPRQRKPRKNDAREILRYVGWIRRMGAEAEKRGLHEQNPLKLQLEMARIQLLSNAIIQQHEIEEIVTPSNSAAITPPTSPPTPA